MDRRERAEDPEEALRAAFDGLQARLWTGLPAQIVSFNPAKQTAVVQPTIKGVITAPDGTTTLVDMPQLPDCPVQFPSGGGCTITFPLTAGDECFVVFASRGIDWWWQSGGLQPPAEARMHDLSDGVVIPGIRSLSRALSNISTSAVEIRSDDGLTKLSLNPTDKTVAITAQGGTTVNGDLTVTGNVNLGGTGGPAVARVGDAVSGGVITSGSSKVKAS